YGLRSVALRYFNAAGAHEDGTLGEEHEPEVHLIPLVVAAALGRRESIDVYGTDYPTPDGTAVRDYVHVSDLAQAHVDALAYLAKGGAPIALNIGTGTGHSVREVIASVERVSGRKVITRDRPRRAGDPPVLVADGSHARRTLGWQPRYTELDAIVKTAWRWHESR
ncbi:MAG: UDP-glucose 4-epimerase, partial [Myxococcaceae bacterium]|nr:UDP-glucose 4-epimerase [Myxococcaceae bacterium]